MINAPAATVLLLPPAPEADTALRESVDLLARSLAASGLPVRVAALPEGAGFTRRLWHLRALVKRHRAMTVLSFAEEDHLLSTALPARGLRRIWVQAHLPGWRTQPAAQRFWRLLPRLAARATLIAPTPEAREHLARTAGAAREDVLHLPLPVPLPQPLPAITAESLRARAPLILFPGPLERAAQPGLLLKALRQLDDARIRLALPAEGPQLEPIRHMLEKLALTERILWLESAEDWLHRLSAARLLCWPARIAPLPNPAVKALAAGLPVVGTQVAGLQAALEGHPEAGDLVPVTDAEALARALSRRLADPGDPAPRQALARRWAAESLLPNWHALLTGRLAPRSGR